MQLDVIIGGATYSLSDGTYALLLEYDGWDSAPLRRLTQAGPLQDGDTDLGFRLEARLARILLYVSGSSEDDLFNAKRRNLLRILAPQSEPHRWRWTVGGTSYEFQGHPVNVEIPRGIREGFTGRAVLRVRCADPTAYDPTAVSISFSLGGGSDALEIPLEIPMVVGASTLDASASVTYAGDIAAYPTLIRITGPITDCVITNTTTGDKLDFTGTTIAVGNYYDIDCRYGNKTVVDSTGASQIADLTADSDLATFRLVPSDSGAETRVNTFSVTGSSVTAATNVELTYLTRYSGI